MFKDDSDCKDIDEMLRLVRKQADLWHEEFMILTEAINKSKEQPSKLEQLNARMDAVPWRSLTRH